MPRARPLPADDALLCRQLAGAMVGVTKSRWDAYAARFECLRRGRRVVQVNPEGKGVFRWLRSSIVAHMHTELANDRPPTPKAPKPEPPTATGGAA